jgi:hypothetical protein
VSVAIAVAYFLGAGHSSVLGEGISDQPAAQLSTWQLLLYNTGYLPALWFGTFGYGALGNTGWLDVAFPALVTTAAFGVWLLAVASGVRRMFPVKAWGLAMGLGALVLYPLYLLVQSRIQVGQGVQSRYLVPLMVIFTGLALLGRRGVALRLTKRQAGAASAALGIAQSIALHVHMRRYVTGFDAVSVSLDRDLEWWWPSAPGPTVVWLVGSVAFTIATYVALRSSTRVQPDGAVLPR